MTTVPFGLSIKDLNKTDSSDRRRIMPPGKLHYCPPSAGGWGIIRVALLVPESVMLFVSPAGCGRHGAIAGLQLGFKKRLFFLHINEADLVSGQHLEKIFQAAADILSSVKPRPRALTICATCIEDLLASDYELIASELQEKHGIPVRACHMNPIAMDGKTPPVFTVQQAIYDFIPPAQEKDNAINIIGNFAALDNDSEFYEVLKNAGIAPIRHIAACSTLEEFYRMGRSAHNILIKPGGRLAARSMEKKLGIPYSYIPMKYGIASIARDYQKLEEVLGVRLETGRYREEAEQAVKFYRKALGPLNIAVGETANASPFELARALTEYGFRVPYIFADLVHDIDEEHIDWLQEHCPEIKVFTNVHPSMVDFLEQGLTVDQAIGFDAGYFCSGAKTVPLSLDRQPFGYRGVIGLLRQLFNTFYSSYNHREQMYASGMVI